MGSSTEVVRRPKQIFLSSLAIAKKYIVYMIENRNFVLMNIVWQLLLHALLKIFIICTIQQHMPTYVHLMENKKVISSSVIAIIIKKLFMHCLDLGRT